MPDDSLLLKTIVDADTEGADAPGVALLQLNRPDARNALSEDLRGELVAALADCDADEQVRCIVIAGNDEYFAAGADIHNLRERTTADNLTAPVSTLWRALADCRTPTIAAVSGYALGGGCELALACDMIVASESAQFGQPEVTLGIIPGGGGTQRLARVMGKQRAMELVLTGRRISADMAEQLGIVNQVAKRGKWLDAAIELAAVVASRPSLAVMLGKQAVLAADEMSMTAGIDYERRLFELTMATEDRVEGMNAFLEKRPPQFRGR